MKILIATDFSECSLAAVSSVLDRSWPVGAEFRVVTVVDPIYVHYAMTGAYVQPMIDAHLEFVKNCRQLINGKTSEIKKLFPKNEVTGDVLEGSPAAEIIQEAKRWHADMIVMGSHGRTGFEHFFLGSVAERVVAHAPCSVSIVKQVPVVKEKRKDEAAKSAVA